MATEIRLVGGDYDEAVKYTSVTSPQSRPFQGLNQSAKLIPALNLNALPSHARAGLFCIASMGMVGLFCTVGMGMGMVELIGWVAD